ncbi:hypothetical protein [Haloplanus halobius]|uniref:hypothetical protein n=1 Tax=Haloplanus halobius TaxID=2934938 RepID=UPI00200F9D2F|nr:hypothetical protein [Haloplanus sp. XH21]
MSSATPAPSDPAPDDTHRKSALFCPACGHTSPVDGDWHVKTVADHRQLRCPDCHRVVDDRDDAEALLCAD